MGNIVSTCGLTTNEDDKDHLSEYEKYQYENNSFKLLASDDRTRSFSGSTDTSVASILSNSDRLIPEAYMPQDIQVLSQRRQRVPRTNSGRNDWTLARGHSQPNIITTNGSALYHRNPAADSIGGIHYASMTMSGPMTNRNYNQQTCTITRRRSHMDGESNSHNGSLFDFHGTEDEFYASRRSKSSTRDLVQTLA